MSNRFKKPTPKEVEDYALSRGFPLDGEEFCDFYASKGWVVGKSPMKDWRAAVRTWERTWRKRKNSEVMADIDSSDLDSVAEQFTEEIDEETFAREYGGLFEDFNSRSPEK